MAYSLESIYIHYKHEYSYLESVHLVHEFFQGFCNHAGVTLHMDSLRGVNAHHVAETLFKAFGRALRVAVVLDPRMGDAVPSTKGLL